MAFNVNNINKLSYLLGKKADERSMGKMSILVLSRFIA